MMRRPWQIWLLYGLCLAVVLPAMGWLTQQTLHADRAEYHAALAAEREETVGSVLWQMDTELTTLLAQEAARPHFVYSSFYSAPTMVVPAAPTDAGSPAPKAPEIKPATGERQVTEQLPSPLLTQPSTYVLLHFQLDTNNVITSPQVPSERLELAIQNGTSAENIRSSDQRLATLKEELRFESLASLLPDNRLASVVGHWHLNDNTVASDSNSQVVGNTLDYPNVQQQIAANETQQAADPPSQQAFEPYANARSQSRAGNDLAQRNRAYQTAAQRQIVEQRLNYFTGQPRLKFISEGVSQPLWVGDRLLLARRVTLGDEQRIQGCWLDWEKLQSDLVARYAGELPGVRLVPMRRDADDQQIKLTRLLATLPAQVSLPELPLPPQPWSPLRLALVVAWSMLGLAACAVAVLLQGVITLSERRGAFVSAVTHELRTPLTTFRMYAEMLADNMVPSATTRQQYLETLRVEADRLSHLVENVLAYARLERGRHGERREVITLGKLLDHAQHRFADRAAQAEMQLLIEPSDQRDVCIRTDPSAVEQILFNLIDNACKYAAEASDKRLHLSLATVRGYAVVRVTDHGPGINAKAARRLFQPFSKSVHDAACSAPGVGLGLALSRRLAAALGGKLELEPAERGATFALYLPLAR